MKFLKIKILSILLVFYISPACADPNVMETFKGLGSVVTDPKFNPITGALAEAYLKGVRYYGYYGENKEKENPLLKCIVKNRTNPLNNEQLPDNCPQDAVTSLIQWLFPNATMDGNFAPNRRGAQFKDLVSTFTPQTIGHILNEIALVQGKYNEGLASKITEVILADFSKSLPLESIPKKTKAPEEIRKNYEGQFNNLGEKNTYTTFESVLTYLSLPSMDQKSIKLKPTQKQLNLGNKYKKEINKLSSSVSLAKIEKTYQEQAILFGQIIVQALRHGIHQESTSLNVEKIETSNPNILMPSVSQEEIYYPDIVEMALLHFVWAISKDKQDIIALLTAMPAVVDLKQLKTYENSEDVYTKKDYLNLKSQLSGEELLEGTLGFESAGLLGFGFQYFEMNFPKKIGYTTTPLFKEKYDPLNPKQERYEVIGGAYTQGEIPDCGESSLRTILMFLLFNKITRIFDIDLLVKNATLKKLEVYPLLVDFFKTYFSPSLARSYGARADWMRTTSFLENGIEYVKKAGLSGKFSEAPVCEINAGLSNMMKLLSVFLGLSAKPTEEKLIDMTPLNTLLELISTEDSKWEWRTENNQKEILKGKNKNINIIFLQNKTPIFTWVFMEQHFDTMVHVTQKSNWLQKKGETLLKSKEILPIYFLLFVDDYFIPSNVKDLNLTDENISLLFYSRNLWDINVSLNVLGKIGEVSFNSFINLGKRLIDSAKALALVDINTQENLIVNSFKSTELGNYVINILNLKGDERFAHWHNLLHLACKSGNLFFVKKYIQSPSLIKKDVYGNAPIYFAVGAGHLEVVKFLVEHGADVNAKDNGGVTVFHVAAANGYLEVVKFLIEHGADVSAKDDEGGTVLHFAAMNGHLKVIKFLIERGADVSAKDDEGRTVLHFAAMNGHLEVIKFLVQNQMSVHAKDNEGKTVLHFAAANGHLEVVKFLVQSRANIHAKDDEGKTVLHFAAKNGHLEVVKFLVEHGADVNAKDNNGETVLHYAAEKGYLDIVKFLVQKKVGINGKNNESMTPLHLAAKYGHPDVVRYLVEQRADVQAEARGGRTPLYFAEIESIKEYLGAVNYIQGEFKIKFPTNEQIEKVIFAHLLGFDSPSLKILKAINILKSEKKDLPTKEEVEQKIIELEQNTQVIETHNPTENEMRVIKYIQVNFNIKEPTIDQIKKVFLAESIGFNEPSLKVLKAINRVTEKLKRTPLKKEVEEEMKKMN